MGCEIKYAAHIIQLKLNQSFLAQKSKKPPWVSLGFEVSCEWLHIYTRSHKNEAQLISCCHTASVCDECVREIIS